MLDHRALCGAGLIKADYVEARVTQRPQAVLDRNRFAAMPTIKTRLAPTPSRLTTCTDWRTRTMPQNAYSSA